MSGGMLTFSLVNAVFLGAAATAWIVVRLTRRHRDDVPDLRAAACAFAVLALLTAVFDNVMIAAGLFDYDESKRLGILIGRAPIEDFAYPLAGAILLPALWHALRRTRRTGDVPGAGDDMTVEPAGSAAQATRSRAVAATEDVTAARADAGASPRPERRPSRLGQVLLASRPLSWVNTALPFAAAYVFTTREIDVRLLVGSLFFLVPYNLLMYGVNDVFDYESDKRNPRKGGAEGALLDEGLHRLTLLSAALVPVPFVIWLLFVGSWAAAAVLLVMLFAVIAYSAPGLRFKERPVLDSATSSTHFVGPAVYGFVLAGADLGLTHVLILVAFFLWGMASQAFGAVQDVQADRAGGLGSIATVFGAARTVRLALAAWAAAAVLLIVTPWPGAVAAALVVPYMALAWPYRNVSDEHSAAANAGWRRFLGANYAVGAALTQILIGLWQLTA